MLVGAEIMQRCHLKLDKEKIVMKGCGFGARRSGDRALSRARRLIRNDTGDHVFGTRRTRLGFGCLLTALRAPAGGQFTEEYDEKTQHGLMKDLMRSDRTENAHQQVPDDR